MSSPSLQRFNSLTTAFLLSRIGSSISSSLRPEEYRFMLERVENALLALASVEDLVRDEQLIADRLVESDSAAEKDHPGPQWAMAFSVYATIMVGYTAMLSQILSTRPSLSPEEMEAVKKVVVGHADLVHAILKEATK